MPKTFTFFCFLFISFTSFSQGKSDPTPEDAQQAKTLKSTYEEEAIVALSKNIVITFDINEQENLVKVFKEKKVRLMNIALNSRIQYPVFYDSESEVEDFDLKDRRGHYLEEFHSPFFDEYLNNEDIFHGDYRVKFTNLIFPLQGTSYNIETEKKYNDIKYFGNAYFSGPFRILEGKITIHVPEWLDMEIVEYNFEEYDITKTSSTGKKGEIITYTFKNLPPRSKESHVPGPSYIYPHLVFNAKSFSNDGAANALFNSVDDLYAWCNGLVKNVNVDASVFAGKVAELTANATTDEQKIKNIYYWVQDNIRYIAFEDGIAGFQPESPQNVFKKRYGDCKGMAFLTQAMLKEAGIDSRLVWIGTDRLVYDYSVPSLVINNHMICAVKLNDEFIFLDATEKYNRFEAYATRIQNKPAMVQNGDGFKIITVPQSNKILNIDEIHYKLSLENGILKGNASRKLQAECRVSFQNAYTNFGKGDRTEALSNFLASGNNDFHILKIAPFEAEKRNKPLTIAYDLEIDNAVSEFDGTLYIDLDPAKNASDWIFKERKSSYKFPIKKHQITEIELTAPTGFKIGPLPGNFVLSNELIDIKLSYEHSGNTINYKKEIYFKKRLLEETDFEIWNAAFDLFREKLNRQITLVKS